MLNNFNHCSIMNILNLACNKIRSRGDIACLLDTFYIYVNNRRCQKELKLDLFCYLSTCEFIFVSNKYVKQCCLYSLYFVPK